jgi:hypothetical protein
MSNSLPHSIIARHEPERAVTPYHVLVLLSLSLAAIAWGEAFMLGGGGLQLQSYLALLGFYAAASAAFVMSRIRRGKLQLFEIPVFITGMAFFEFGLAPLRNFIDPTQIDRHLSANGEELVLALFYCILGMVGFWAGCQAARRKQDGPTSSGLSNEATVPASRQAGIILSTIALYAIAFGTKFYLLRSQLYSFTGSLDKYFANLASMQVLNLIAEFGTFALVVATIERYRKRSNPTWKVLFWFIFSSEILWGLISGMKAAIFQNFLLVALVSSVIQRRLNLRWLILPAFGFVLFYPVSNAYRGVLTRGGPGVVSFAGAGRAGQMAFKDATQEGASAGSLWSRGQISTLQRFDLLTCVAEVLTLGPRAGMVKGDMRWWMLPIYPFVPRFLWPSKPILDEGGRFTAALIGGSGIPTTGLGSVAVTYPGDLYLQFGLLAIPVGMFLFGLVAQLFTNRLSGPFERHDLFIYTCFFLFGFPLEADVFSIWSSFIKLLAILYLLSWVIYGPRSRPRRLHPSPPVPARQL